MCLVCKRSDRFVADKDMKVYKYVLVEDGGHWTGIFRYNSLAFSFDETVRPGSCEETEDTDEFLPYADDSTVGDLVVIGEGWFHSFISISECLSRYGGAMGSQTVLCVCTIPKGTVCYKDDKEIASKNIIVYKPENL